MFWSATGLGYNWQWYRIPRHLLSFDQDQPVPGELLLGLFSTLQLSGLSLVLSLGIGLLVAIFRLSESWVARQISALYLGVIRNTPLLVQIYLMYFVAGPILGLDRFWSAVLALSLFEGAYISEIFRAGIVSLHRGQWEAAYSLGLSEAATYRWVILPQAFVRVLPPLTSELISLIKNTSLVSLVSLSDLAMEAQIVAADTFLTFEVWFTTAALYLVITVPLSLLVYSMEKRFRVLS